MTRDEYEKTISKAVNTTVAAVSVTTQQQVAARINQVFAGTDTPAKKVKGLKALISELEKGEMKYD